MHIGFLLPPHYTGHLNPGSTLAGALKARGHEVTLFACPMKGERYAKRENLNYCPIYSKDVEQIELDMKKIGDYEGLASFRATVKAMRSWAPIVLNELPDAIEKTNIDVLLVDELVALAGAAVAESKKIPFGTIADACTVMYLTDCPVPAQIVEYPKTKLGRWKNDVIWYFMDKIKSPDRYKCVNEYRVANGLKPLDESLNLNTTGVIQLAQQPFFFEFPKSDILADHFFYTTPWHKLKHYDIPFPFDKIKKNKKLVYASLGTVHVGIETVYKNICEACKGLEEVQLVVGLGRKDATLDIPPEDLPEDCIVVGYAPQLKLLEMSSMVITHCGMNTALETLKVGIPAVCIPFSNDQPAVAVRWKRLGAAVIAGTPRDATPKVIRQCIDQILPEDSSYRAVAKELQRKVLNESPTLDQTAELVETAFKTAILEASSRQSAPGGFPQFRRDHPEALRVLKGTKVEPPRQADEQLPLLFPSYNVFSW